MSHLLENFQWQLSGLFKNGTQTQNELNIEICRGKAEFTFRIANRKCSEVQYIIFQVI